MHRINLEKYEVRTDLAVDLIEENNKLKKYEKDNVNISWIKLDDSNNFGKQKGTYITLEFDDITDNEYQKKVSDIFKEELSNMLNMINYNKNMKTCIIGLGNRNSTPDILGNLVVDNIIVTNHLFEMNINVDKNFSRVCSFCPGVMGQTGIETKDYIKGVVDEIKPDLVIVIDSLASNSIQRVNRSIQITDSGISPGSGVGNNRCEITKESIGVPVLAIGVPTVTSASVIVSDTINYMIKNYSYNKKFLKSKTSKLTLKNINYLNKESEITTEDKKTLLGLVGLLSYDELFSLTNEVLTPIGYNLMVTPKEIDFVIKKLSEIISFGINNCLHDL